MWRPRPRIAFELAGRELLFQCRLLRIDREGSRIGSLVPERGVAIAEIVARRLDTPGQPSGVGLGDTATALALLAVVHRLREIVVYHWRVMRIRPVLVHDLPVARGLIDVFPDCQEGETRRPTKYEPGLHDPGADQMVNRAKVIT